LQACFEDVSFELSRIFDIQEKQSAVKAPVESPDCDSASKSAASERRIAAFKALSVASLSRSIAAVYVVCVLELFVHAQLFEIMKQKKQGTRLHENSIRRYLSIVQGFGRGDPSILSSISQRVDCGVRDFFNTRSLTEKIDSAGVRTVVREVRSRVENSCGHSGEGHTWICRLILRLLKSRMPIAPISIVSSLIQEYDEQLQMLLGTMEEILESEVFAEALSAAYEKAFSLLEDDIIATNFVANPNGDSPVTHIALAKLAPAASNLFSRILEPRRVGVSDEGSYGAIALEAAACSSLFLAVSSS
jgi:hypothetical protein